MAILIKSLENYSNAHKQSSYGVELGRMAQMWRVYDLNRLIGQCEIFMTDVAAPHQYQELACAAW
jgi:hypothetical protein